jgi:hypothetical protein
MVRLDAQDLRRAASVIVLLAVAAIAVLAGLGAAVAAYVIAVPIRHTGDSRRG